MVRQFTLRGTACGRSNTFRTTIVWCQKSDLPARLSDSEAFYIQVARESTADDLLPRERPRCGAWLLAARASKL